MREGQGWLTAPTVSTMHTRPTPGTELPQWCIIILAYNEEGSIIEVLERTRATMQKLGQSYQLLVVDDGSTDHTYALLQQYQSRAPEVKVIRHPRNMGIGKAIHTGFTNASGEWILYMCSDLQFAPEDIADFVPYTQDYDVIIGTRPQRADSFYRRVVSKGYHLLVHWLFGLTVLDANWVQAYRGTLIQAMHIQSQDSQVLTEMLVESAVLRARMIEVLTRHFPRTSGRAKGASPFYIARIAIEIIGLWLRKRAWKRNSAV